MYGHHNKFRGAYTSEVVTDDMIADLGDSYAVANNHRCANVWLVTYLAAGEAEEAWRKSYRPGAWSARSVKREADAREHACKLRALSDQLYHSALKSG